MLARSKLNSIQSTISKVLIGNEISQEDFITIINKKIINHALRESIRMMKIQRSGIKEIN